MDKNDYCNNCNEALLYPQKPCPFCGYKNIDPVRDFFNIFLNKKQINTYENKEEVKINTGDEQQKDTTNTKICQFCGKECINEDKFCIHCENQLSKESIKQPNYFFFYFRSLILTIFLFLVILFLPSILSSGILIWQDFQDNITKLIENRPPDCESESVKQDVISIFQQNNLYYSFINSDSINNIEVRYPAVEDYNKEAKKWSCTGTIVMTSNENGFIPTDTKEPDGLFLPKDYNKYFIDKYRGEFDSVWVKDGSCLKSEYARNQYHTYKCNVNYTSQASEGSSFVKSDYCMDVSVGLWGKEEKEDTGEFTDLTIDNSPIEKLKQEAQREEAEKIQEEKKLVEAQKRQREKAQIDAKKKQEEKEFREDFTNLP